MLTFLKLVFAGNGRKADEISERFRLSKTLAKVSQCDRLTVAGTGYRRIMRKQMLQAGGEGGGDCHHHFLTYSS